ncbi:ComF family protein [Pseudothermotoga sp. U03pept]|uniref:ComF family protein n=1 Tax=Pseudothermotoga sp. U03pept TaxID=3447012 RepID=UPI0030A50976
MVEFNLKVDSSIQHLILEGAKTLKILDLLFPNRCSLCGCTIKMTELICEKCMAELSNGPITLREKDEFFEAYFYGRYESKLRELILLYKNAHHWRLHEILALFIVKTIERYPSVAQSITWVPSSLFSLEERGFDTMLLIAQAVSRKIHIPIKSVLQSSSRSNKRGMTRQERRNSVKGSFLAFRGVNEDIALIDDVFTTGSTVKECAKVLKEAGARSITVYCIARA